MAEKSFLKNLPPSGKTRDKPKKPPKISAEELVLVSQIHEEALKGCWTAVQVSKKLGVASHKIQKMIRRHKIPLMDRDEKIVERIREEIALDPSRPLTEIAKALDVPYMRMYKLIRRYSIPVEQTGRRVFFADQVADLARDGNTQAEIAKKLGTTRQRVHEVVKEYKIPVRLHDPHDRPFRDEAKYKRAVKLFEKGVNKHQAQLKTKFSSTTILIYYDQWKASQSEQVD